MSEPSVSMWMWEGSVSVSLVARCLFDTLRFGGKLLCWEHDLILVVIPFRLVVNTSGQGIWLGQMSASSMGKRVVESGQIEGPPGLMTVQYSEICEVSVVVQDLDHVFSPFQYVSPLLKSMYD